MFSGPNQRRLFERWEVTGAVDLRTNLIRGAIPIYFGDEDIRLAVEVDEEAVSFCACTE